MNTYEDEGRSYYCLASDGDLWILGDHGDYEAAEATAESMGLEVIWIFDETSAQQWRNVLGE